MLEKFKEFEIENQLVIFGGRNVIVDPECFEQPD